MKNKYTVFIALLLFTSVLVFYFVSGKYRSKEIVIDENGKRFPAAEKKDPNRPSGVMDAVAVNRTQ